MEENQDFLVKVDKNKMKKLLGILVLGLCGITRYKLDTEEIKQDIERYEQRKRK